MIIRFQYLANPTERPRVKALIKINKESINLDNALNYLVKRYPDRYEIEIIEIVYEKRQ